MKFGTLTPSYRVVLGFGPDAHGLDDSIKRLTTINGSVVLLNYGARKERQTDFTIARLSKDEFIELADYLIANTGKPVKVTQETDSEKLFGEWWAPTEYYCSVLESGSYSEADFTPSRRTFELKVKLALIGENSTDNYNASGESLFDLLLEIDTTGGADTGATPPASPDLRDRWLDTAGYLGTAGDLFECIDPDAVAEADRWEKIREVVDADATIGMTWGVIRLSAFADVPADVPNGILNDFKGGIINFESFKAANQSINLMGGPAVAHKSGFSFSLDNSTAGAAVFWQKAIDDSIVLYNAIVKAYFVRRSSPVTVHKLGQGRNVTNTFSYSDYLFQIEPEALGKETVFPSGEISGDDADYTGINPDLEGEAPFATFGEHKFAALQNVSIADAVDRVTSAATGQLVSVIDGALDYSVAANTSVLIAKGGTEGYTFPADLAADIAGGQHALRIRRDTTTSSDNAEEVRRITAFEDEPAGYAGWYVLTVDSGFPTRPGAGTGDPPETTDRIEMVLEKSGLQFQIDTELCKGFGAIDDNGNFNADSIDLWAIDENGRDLVAVPKTSFVVNAKKNRLTLLPQARGNSATVESFEEFGGGPAGTSDYYPCIRSGLLVPQGPDFPETGGLKRAELDLDIGADFRDYHTEMARYTDSGVYVGDGLRLAFAAVRRYADLPKFTGSQGHIVSSGAQELIGPNTVKTGFSHYIKCDTFAESSEDFFVNLVRWPISHAGFEDLSDLDGKKVYLGMDLSIISEMVFSLPGQYVTRSQACGVNIRFQFRKRNGDPVRNDAWIIEAEPEQLSVGDFALDVAREPHRLRVRNLPDGDTDGGFTPTENTLPDNYDERLTHIVEDRTARDALIGALLYGDRCYVIDENTIDEWDGTAWQEGAGPVVNGDIAVVYRNRRNFTGAIVFDDTEDDGYRAAVYGVDYDTDFEQRGRGLVDISELFVSPASWSDIVYLEVLISNKDYTGSQFNNTRAASRGEYGREWFIDFRLNRSFQVFGVKEFDLADKPLFVTCRGRELGAPSVYSRPDEIAGSILDTLYPGMYDASALAALVAGAARESWKWRRQFVAAESADQVVEDLALNLWAGAYWDADDKLVFKSIAPFDNGTDAPTRVFTDGQILEDSFSKPTMRSAGEIFQRFKFKHSQNMAAKFSNSIDEFITQAVNEGNATTEQRFYIQQSRRLFNNEKVLEKEFKYFYDGDGLPFAAWVVRFFSFNAWEISFEVPITETIGSNALTMLQPVGLTSYFHTGSEQVNGYVVGINPDIYSGTCEVTIFIPEPPGAKLCDIFKDALLMPDRGSVATWTEANNLVNDAGADISTRPAATVEDDAGVRINLRKLTCF